MTDHGGHPPLSHIWSSDQSLYARVRQMIAHPSSVKLIKYASVSVISTVVSQVTLLLTFGVFHVMSEVPANILANVLATIPSYWLNRRWVWGKGGKSHFWRGGRALLDPVLHRAGLLEPGGLARRRLRPVARPDQRATALLVNAANLLSFGILWIVKFVIYNKLFHIDPIEYEEHHAEKVAAASDDARRRD